MSSIRIHDLSNSSALDTQAMSAVRGGFAWGGNVNANVNVDQKIVQLQDIQLNVLNNNGAIGPGFVGPSIDFDPTQKATNNAAIPKFF